MVVDGWFLRRIEEVDRVVPDSSQLCRFVAGGWFLSQIDKVDLLSKGHLCAMRPTLSLVVLLLLVACQNRPERSVYPAFYHWQTQVALGDAERVLLDSLRVDRLYLKFFDLDWSERYGAAVPLANVRAGAAPLPVAEIVPCVFITNRTFQRVDRADLPVLAQRVGAKLRELASRFPANRVVEWQFDCDWTASTRGAYFYFLELLAKEGRVPLSATIRLHQVADAGGTGVPPVARGMLMYYNTGELRNWATENSMLEDRTAAAYLGTLEDYPLPLDVALPVFRWGVVFHPAGGVELLNNLDESDIDTNADVVWTGEGRAEVRRGTYLRGHYVSAADRIRLESISRESLLLAAQRLRKVATPDSMHVAFYQLDEAMAKRYAAEALNRIVDAFR